MKIIFITDPLHMKYGSVRPAIELAKVLKMKWKLDTTLFSEAGDESVISELTNEGIEVTVLKQGIRTLTGIPTFDKWLKAIMTSSVIRRVKDNVLNMDVNAIRTEQFIINTSSVTYPIRCHVYYGQGPMSIALKDMYKLLPSIIKIAIKMVLPFLGLAETKFLRTLRTSASLFIANSKFCASMYEAMNIRVNGVIYPPVDTEKFRPRRRASEEYVLTYLGVGGKEGDVRIIRTLAEKGLEIRVFGVKSIHVPYRHLLEHPNIKILGFVSDEELIQLYSNALYTLFTFSHEPFGYVPVESMACGTPVLTYNMQGPRETVINGITGWLADNDRELVRLAVKIWKDGYPRSMRNKCRSRALKFDTKSIAAKWFKLIHRFLERAEGY